MAVAEKIADVTNANIENAFVVGATGEADAMSISGKAAELKTPIIVSGFEGLSEETLDELDGVNVTVLGGDASVSDAEYETIDAVAGSIKRISGSDRKE
ncbi:cell wall-binding repeat-containing protein, partial [Streptococcus anginosus]|uniref:cell wall-binding repeat-containing protein n=1 Tax=Streptococcus anginosus TaxID=1328 RepID=UPI00301032B3